jgi:Type IV Pilus-assembly protein W
MVGLTVGLLLMGALTAIFLASSRSSTTQTEDSRILESARLAMHYLGRSIRQSGFNSNLVTTIAYSPIEANTQADKWTPDSLTLRRDAISSTEQDCTGTNAGAIGATISETFYVAANSARGTSSLYCSRTGAASGGVELAPGVINMKLTFAIDADKNGTVDKAYVTTLNATSPATAVSLVRVDLTLAGTSNSDVSRATTASSYCKNHTTVACKTFYSSFLLRNQTGS